METFERVLAEHPFLSGMDARHIRLLAERATSVRFNAGDFVFREGEEADRFYLLGHGKVALEVSVPERGAIVIQTLGAGDALGWSWLFPPFRWHFDARALELTRAIAMDGAWVWEKCEEDPTLGYELMKRVAQVMMQRLQATRLQLLDIYGNRS